MESAASNPVSGVGTTSSNPSSGSRSHRSRSRNSRRHRSRSHHRSSRSRRHNPKRVERNLIAAILGMIVIAVLISSLAEQKWFHLQGGTCSHAYLGVYEFLTPGIENSSDYAGCLNSKVVYIMRAVIAFSFIAISLSLFAFFLDTLGPMQPTLRVLRRHAIGNMLTVILCLMMAGFCYWAAVQMEYVMSLHKLAVGSRVLVSFDVGYYLITSSGAISLIIAATNLLRPYSSYEEPPRERLMDDWDHLLEAELASIPTTPTLTPSGGLIEPPAYTP